MEKYETINGVQVVRGDFIEVWGVRITGYNRYDNGKLHVVRVEAPDDVAVVDHAEFYGPKGGKAC